MFKVAVEAEGARLCEIEAALMTAAVDIWSRAVEPSVIVAFVLDPAATVAAEGSLDSGAVSRIHKR